MLLALAATQIEMAQLTQLLEGDDRVRTLITGVGPVETAVRLTRFLAGEATPFAAAINFGIAGGYVAAGDAAGPALLDLYLAETEAFGDTGICFPDRIEPLPEDLAGKTVFQMDPALLAAAGRICNDCGILVKTGRFITVTATSGSFERGRMLARGLGGQCENMEGAAVARVCEEFALPVLEIRCISNLVEDRDPAKWRLEEAVAKAGRTAAEIIKHIIEYS